MIALTKTKVIAYLAAIFAAGVLAGVVAGYTLARPAKSKSPWSPPDSASMARHTLDRLESRLQLSPEQVGKIRGIVEQSFAAAQTRSSSHFKEVGEIFRRMNEQIGQHLTPDQKTLFECMERERWERMRNWGKSRSSTSPSEARDGTNCSSSQRDP